MSSLLLLMLSVPKRFVVGGTNDREREGSQVSEGMVERMLRACSLLGRMCDVLCVELVHPKLVPSMGGPTLPFIDQGGAGVTDGRKRKIPKV